MRAPPGPVLSPVPSSCSAPSAGPRRLSTALIAIAALFAGACAQEAERLPASGDAETPQARIQKFLDDRSARVRAGDAGGYLATLRPEAAAVEQGFINGAVRAPIAGFRQRIDSFVATGGGTFDVGFESQWAYDNLPENNVFSLGASSRFASEKGSWVAESTEITGVPPIWAAGPFEFSASPHFLALYRPGAGDIPSALKMAEDARARLMPKLQLQPDPAHLMLLARDLEDLEEMTGQEELEGTLALAIAFQKSTAGVVRRVSRHLVVNLDAIQGSEARAIAYEGTNLLPVEIFQHELAHLALLPFRGTMPGWVSEGAAMYLSGEQRRVEWELMVEADALQRLSVEELSDFGDLPGIFYGYANAAVLNLVETRGEKKFWQFFRGFNEVLRDEGGVVTNRLMRRVYGFDVAELDRQTREWIKAHVARG